METQNAGMVVESAWAVYGDNVAKLVAWVQERTRELRAKAEYLSQQELTESIAQLTAQYNQKFLALQSALPGAQGELATPAHPSIGSSTQVSAGDLQDLLAAESFPLAFTVKEMDRTARQIVFGSTPVADAAEAMSIDGSVGAPTERLIFTGKSASYTLVVYEFGGYVFGKRLVVIGRGEKPAVLWSGNLEVSELLRDMADLRRLVSCGKIWADK